MGLFKTQIITALCGRRIPLLSLFLIAAMLPVGTAMAVGIGEIVSKTSIGEPLRIEIPLHNVEPQNALMVSIETDYKPRPGEPALSAVINRTASHTWVVVSSEYIFGEPYLKFQLKLSEGERHISRSFTVMLDIPGEFQGESMQPEPIEDAATSLLMFDAIGGVATVLVSDSFFSRALVMSMGLSIPAAHAADGAQTAVDDGESSDSEGGDEAIDQATINADLSSEQVIISLTRTIDSLTDQLEVKDQKIEELENRLTNLSAPDSAGQSLLGIKLVAWQWLLLGGGAVLGVGLLVWRLRSSMSTVDQPSIAQATNVLPDDQLAESDSAIGLASSIVPGADSDGQEPVEGAVLAKTNHIDGNTDVLDSTREFAASHSHLELDDSFSVDADGGIEVIEQDDAEGQDTQVSESISVVTEDAGLNSEAAVPKPIKPKESVKVAEETLDLRERIGVLLNEGDFDGAKELLKFASDLGEIDGEEYHCEQLRVLQATQDQDAFYRYYYEIESQIPDFPRKLQTKISEYVIQVSAT